MSEQDLNQEEEVTTTPAPGSESEDDGLSFLFKEEEAPDGESAEDKAARLEEEMANYKKQVAKAFSDKGRKEKAAKEATAKEVPNHASDDVTELFLESKPEAELVKDDLKVIADAKYGGSIIKAWKGETWLHEKASALSADLEAKGKINPPSTTVSGAMPMEAIAKLPDEEQAAAIRKMDDKTYSKYKDYLKRQSESRHAGMISLSPR